ncbi:unnamed protein product [Diatraea saccharalis]|uniref:Chitin-binding type-2 domain-containing protein n=1 Tax=Diatraea saccharalis TaxID=40085 RepID=A0A9N9RCX5_9NEOP|nr:unnamed protein product [Diatraea saccharalis]
MNTEATTTDSPNKTTTDDIAPEFTATYSPTKTTADDIATERTTIVSYTTEETSDITTGDGSTSTTDSTTTLTTTKLFTEDSTGTEDFVSSTMQPTTPSTSVPPICPPGTFGNIPHPVLCNSFFMCAGGSATLLNCTAGFEFDPEKRSCVPIAPGGCTLGPVSTGAPELSTTKEFSTTDTGQTEDNYSTVSVGITTVSSSETTQSTTLETDSATLTTTVGLDGSTPEEVINITTQSSIHEITTEATTTDISNKTTTDNIVTVGTTTVGNTTEETSDSTTWDGSTSTTDPTTILTTSIPVTEGSIGTEDFVSSTVQSTTPSTSAPSICPPGTFGNIPHPVLCSSFFMCVGGSATLLNCTSGFEFDPEKRSCVPIAPGGCTLGPVTTGAPEWSTTKKLSTTDTEVNFTTSDGISTVADSETTETIILETDSSTQTTTSTHEITATNSPAKTTADDIATEGTTTVINTTEVTSYSTTGDGSTSTTDPTTMTIQVTEGKVLNFITVIYFQSHYSLNKTTVFFKAATVDNYINSMAPLLQVPP